MSIERGWGRSAVALFGVLLLAACGGADSDAVEETGAPVAAEPMSPAEPAAEAPATIAELFPEGEGQQIVLNNCASCHAVACAAIGQRPEARWTELGEAHAEHVPSLSEEDRRTAFAYLAQHFSDAQPEPNVPPQFLERGCTPF